MLIIGTVEINLPRGTGQFFCPVCREDAEYKHKQRRNFLTLYFIPVLPLNLVREFVKCQRCETEFGPEATEFDRVTVLESLRRGALEHIYRAMILMMIADQESSDEEIRVIRRYMERIGGWELSKEHIRADAELATQAMTTAVEYVGRVADKLDEQECEELAVGAFLVATAGGPPSEAQLEDLQWLPLALGMNEQRFREIIAMASDVEV